ncbi:MAG: 50S ribosomal protein L19 [Candidatus Paceibacterota bacterium]|jgi:large subunit ribosomal protein L19
MESKIIISPIDMAARKNLELRSGDTVRVWQKIKEGEKARLQAFEGLILARKHGSEAGATFTVRKTIDGVGVERIFPLYSPVIDEIEILRRSKVRRAKLYFVRTKAAKEIRRQMRNLRTDKTANTDVVKSTKKAVKKEEKAEVKA